MPRMAVRKYWSGKKRNGALLKNIGAGRKVLERREAPWSEVRKYWSGTKRRITRWESTKEVRRAAERSCKILDRREKLRRGVKNIGVVRDAEERSGNIL